MRRFPTLFVSRSLVFALFLFGSVGTALSQVNPGSAAVADRLSASFAGIAKAVEPAVVSIDTKGKMPDVAAKPAPGSSDDIMDFLRKQIPKRPSYSVGSGFIVDKTGYILTNNHVIEDAARIVVKMSSGEEFVAKVVGADEDTDLAVLKIEAARELPFVKLGDSEKMNVGDWVLAIGSPFGLTRTVTAGIISQVHRETPYGTPFQRFIQTDAAINRGNSGGPLFNSAGEVIGINTAIISPSGGSIGIGFSIPSQLASGVVEQLRQYGETRRGWLGVRIQPVTDDIAESLGMATAKGALVAGVIKGGPVDNGTIQAGDVIIKFDGKDIHEMRDLPRVVAESPVGKAVDVLIVRKGVEQTVKVTLGRLEDSEKLASGENGNTDQDKADKAPAVSTASVLGMTVGELNDDTRKKFSIAADVSGVVITDVAKDSAAAERGIQPGEVITEIAQESVATPKDVMDRIGALKEQGRKNALLMLASKTGELRFVTIRMD
jgi:serine protease Do